MHIALYREFRPAAFDQMIGQDHIVRILKNQIRTGNTSHAYLFSGTRGTGKTTTARILAKALNCTGEGEKPCCQCESCRVVAPGSPSIQNVIAMTNLNTPSTAAFAPSMVAVIVEFVLIFVWLEWRARSFTKKGYFFDDSRLKFQLDPEELGQGGREDLPHWGIALAPIVLILVLFNGFKVPVEAAVFAGVAAATILMWKKVPGGVKEWLKVFNKGAADSGVSILNTAIVVGFGGIVQKTQGFQDLVAALKTWNISPLVFVMLTVAICAGACGSASGGMGVAFNALTDTYVELGANLEQVHRIAAIAAGTLDTLPHQGAQITLLGICKMTHKEAYFDIFVTQIAIPFIACFVFIACCGMGM